MERGGGTMKHIYQLTEPDGNVIDTLAMTADEASLRNDDQVVIDEPARWLRSEGDNIFKRGKHVITDNGAT